MEVNHNLPNPPYKRFFGREESIRKIRETLIEGGTFIASVDGVGGIGKTALAYYFCKEILVPEKKFNYVVWITSKKTVFDAYSKEVNIKQVENNFRGIETLINSTLQVVGFDEFVNKELAEKKDFFEQVIINSEKIFFVLDNLENVDDDEFFTYITRDFNRFSANNRDLKVLTTSRKRKRIIDFPIEIEGLSVEDALLMLKYLARENNIKDILNVRDEDNVALLKRIGYVPVLIEFVIGQMAHRKNRGQIYRELEGYPNLDVSDETEKKKRMSQIMAFCFQDMYETLDFDHQRTFKTISALQKNKKKNEEISFEYLMNYTNYSKSKLDEILENLLDSKLIELETGEYGISQMANNFVRQNYEDFEPFENEVLGLKRKIATKGYQKTDKVDLFLESVKLYLDENKYDDAERFILNSLDVLNDARLYYELAKIQRLLNKFDKASDNFRMGTSIAPHDAKIWYDWINMQDSRRFRDKALSIADEALEKTNSNVSIVVQMLNILKVERNYDRLREEAKEYLNKFEKEDRKDDYIKILRAWKNIEYSLLKDNISNQYIEVAELLASKEQDREVELQVLEEILKVARKARNKNVLDRIRSKIKLLPNVKTTFRSK